MLKQRILTALVLIPLVMLGLFRLPQQGFMLLTGVLFLGGSLEYSRLAGLSGKFAAYLLIFLQAAIFALLFQFQDRWGDAILLYLGASCAAWLVMFIRLPLYRAGTRVDPGYRLVSSVTALASLGTGWFALCWLHGQSQGPWLLLLMLLMVWAADTGAYFSGKLLGKSKLAPAISPGKTRAGFVGGLAASPLVALLALEFMPETGIDRLAGIVLGLTVALVSVGGDLLISLHKRISGYKDSGNLFPGHGGILDRLDSLLAAAPFFALGLLLTGQ